MSLFSGEKMRLLNVIPYDETCRGHQSRDSWYNIDPMGGQYQAINAIQAAIPELTRLEARSILNRICDAMPTHPDWQKKYRR